MKLTCQRLTINLNSRKLVRTKRKLATHPLKHQLRDSLPNLDFKVLFRVVEQQDFNLSAVVCIDDTSPCVNKVLARKS